MSNNQQIVNKPTVILLMGPTASSKTELAIQLCQQLPVEIISVDSALIYKGMDIGTAKPNAHELALAPHRLIDIKDPKQSYSAAQFCMDALTEIKNIIAMGKIPLLVGGTMLYFKALLEGLSPLPSANANIRNQIEQQASIFGWQALHHKLQKIDPIAAFRIHKNDPQRISRALEVFYLTGKTRTELTHQETEVFPYRTLQFAIAPKHRNVLHQRIELRFNKMLSNGFQQEVERLVSRGDLHQDLPAIRCVGYRQMWEFLHHKYLYQEMVERGIYATRQLAKRQLTWLRNWKSELTWLDSLAIEEAKQQIIDESSRVSNQSDIL